ncbi:hypothetical protein CspeluHIS016_0407820 [Cutaneotrichosporon spelunceum]|uniref:Major facilitator superfamily (MFS) profile domain-containing protein n=1 Tax=Cutaneotrichosporon spelunceum TaxID=1672016 RepID=A0AAD3TWD0_9TREE|nr:hypothetical protein CspeluHIS016_0407820 [Cutaneotrichosporon spelunceum]
MRSGPSPELYPPNGEPSSRPSRPSSRHSRHSSRSLSRTVSQADQLERIISPRPETVRSIEEAGYSAPVPVTDGVIESAVAPFHSLPNDAKETSAGNEAVDEAARIAELIGPPPDGGRDAWLCVAAAFGQQFAMFGLMTANGQLQAYYLENQLSSYSKADVAWFGSIQTLIEFSFAMFTGRYFDIHGARLLVFSATLLGFVSVVGLAFSHAYYQFLLSYILFGFAASLIYAPSAAVASHWFDKRRGLAIGCVVAGSGLGGVLYPIILAQLFGKIGYRNTMLFVAALNFFLMAPGIWWMKTRLPPRTPPKWSAMKAPWKDVRYVVHVLGAALFGMNVLAPYFTAIYYMNSNHVPSHISDYAVALALSGSLVGRCILGWFADIVGVWKVFGAIGPISGIIMLALWLPIVGTAPAIVGLITYGMISGSWFALLPAATATISPVHEAGTRFGMLVSSLAIPSLVGPVITSALIEKGNNTFKWAAVWVGLCSILAGAVVNSVPLMTWWRRRVAGKEAETDTEAGTVPGTVEKTPDVTAERGVEQK